MNVTTKINFLIDTHPKMPYTECPGCRHCDQIRELGKELESRVKRKHDPYQHILDKGMDMTTDELKILLESEVPQIRIKEALGIPDQRTFEKMAEHFLKTTRKAKKKAITPEEYVECRKAGLANAEIAAKYEITFETLTMYRSKWVKKGLIDKKTLLALPQKKPGVEASMPVTAEQYWHGKKRGWSQKTMAEAFNTSPYFIKKATKLYEVAE